MNRPRHIRNPIHSAIKNRKITLFILAIVLLLGAYNYSILPRQESPEINAPVSMVTVVYPGASPEDVDALVTSKVGEELSELQGFDYLNSYSRNSVSVSIVRLRYGTDTEKAWRELRYKMDDLEDSLPKECEGIEINTDLVETAGMMISMSGDNYTLEELSAYAEQLKNNLSKIDGVSRFEIAGDREKCISVEIDFRLLNQTGLSLSEISNLIASQNVEIPSGFVEENGVRINVDTSGTFNSIEEIKDVIVGISPENGTALRLSDIADIHFDDVESQVIIRQGKTNAVLLTGYFKKDENVVSIGNTVETEIESFRKNLPEDIQFENVHYQPSTVEKSVRTFAMNLLQAILFVVAVVFIGMGMRNAIIVSTAIPASIIATFSLMRLLQINIHQISIAALIVSLGMLVDNAIVISDSIQVMIDRGEDRMKACVEGTRSVAIPVLTSTLTTIAAYMPFLFLNSIAGEYIISLPKIVMISLSASYAVALFVTPSMAYIFFKPSISRIRTSKTANAFKRALLYGLEKRTTVIISISIALVAAVFMTFQLGLQFFPYADTDIIYLNIKSHGSGNMDRTEKLTYEVSSLLDEEPLVVSYTSSIGQGLPKFYNTIVNKAPSQDFAQMLLHLDLENLGRSKEFKDIPHFVSHLQRKMDAAISSGKVDVNMLEQAEPVGAPVTLRLTGSDSALLRNSAENVKNMLTEIEGTKNITDDTYEYTYEFVVNPKGIKTSIFGISNYELQNEISIALRGRESSTFRDNGKEYPIVAESDIDTKAELENLMIKSQATGSKVLLKEIADIELKSQLPVINKYNGELAISVYSDISDGYSSSKIGSELGQMLKDADFPEGIRYEFNGEPEKIRENFGNIAVAAIFAVLSVYLILLIQFKSFLQPLIILITVPLAIIGSITGLFLFNQKLSFVAMLGMVSLLGIVVNNAIILIDFINSELEEGKTIKQSCIDAVNKRMRPIMLSTWTTIIGLTPLVYSGSALFTPMAIALMSGLLISTVLTMVVIPVIYSIVMERFVN